MVVNYNGKVISENYTLACRATGKNEMSMATREAAQGIFDQMRVTH
jgi:hypothetical protein